MRLYEKNVCWIDVWELSPEGMGSLWLKASATLGGIFGLRTSMTGGGGSCPSFSYTVPFALQLMKLEYILFKNTVRISNRTQYFTITKIDWLMPLKEIIVFVVGIIQNPLYIYTLGRIQRHCILDHGIYSHRVLKG
jgi:hypothetical protein